MSSATPEPISSAEEFRRLRTSDDPAEYGRAAAATASVEVWLEIVRTDPEMRFWVAHNKTIPLSVLRILADDADLRVRSMVANKRKLDPPLLEQLARDPEEDIRARVARHAKTSKELLLALRRDPSEYVAEAARAELEQRYAGSTV